MEKYFIVTKESKLNKDYLDYRQNIKDVNEHYKEFSKKHGIEAADYYPSNGYLYIVPTDKDLEQFDKSLKASLDNGLRAFKANSKINKAWIKSLEEKGLKVLDKPYVQLYFRRGFGGRTKTRLFNIGETVYCSIEIEAREIDCPEGMIEIKASEFFKIIEDNIN